MQDSGGLLVPLAAAVSSCAAIVATGHLAATRRPVESASTDLATASVFATTLAAAAHRLRTQGAAHHRADVHVVQHLQRRRGVLRGCVCA